MPTAQFEYAYDKNEAIYVLEGEAIVTPRDGRRAVRLVPGTYAVFPKGLECTWDVRRRVRKHYQEFE
ncbi:hypothetical protein GUITHDRAFT_75169 [Guillardia theta CCMP2712]|uniref:(S)-ureidoglycine aminohydrolase cupin domain-containing protein n=2 Tax=Guillardia theta TaxID=55529 RepID=L1IYD3_GUITC|nr:hypothetical protein GUITHDRAFT_75169 [Guillardia theta CCMP2712]EKX40904.1 hypothetical protein GUITHDRAFT_75169 [Guillardia theta CCMP2712]|eukprot:XP_005827884.1 hypothetical protein GUITHDRAFT_75169 [Guillardia theta CCMP2712]